MSVPDVTPVPPPKRWRAMLALLKRLPQAGLSRGMGRVADIPLSRRLRRPVLGAFARAFGIDTSEAEHPLEAYSSVNAFFVRRLKPGSRSWPTDRGAVASPVDGFVGQVGHIDRGRLVQAKGRSYSTADLLGSEEEAARYRDGVFATLYLSPRDYHRIHAPVAGAIHGARYVPGALLPVNEPSVMHIEDLFARNERLLCTIRGDHGHAAVVAVGAYNVGRISAAFDPAWAGGDGAPWVTNRSADLPGERSYDPPIHVQRGEEIMAFHLGSTVILLFEPGRVELDEAIRPDREVRLGQLLAHSPSRDSRTSH